MKANELRLGNYFVDSKGRLCEVEEISKHFIDCNITAIDSAITSFPIRPIPLTEEWLLKFGFTKIYNGHLNYVKEFGGLNAYGEWEDGKLIGVSVECIHLLIKYVHQLQNLYFSLTGEELIKVTKIK